MLVVFVSSMASCMALTVMLALTWFVADVNDAFLSCALPVERSMPFVPYSPNAQVLRGVVRARMRVPLLSSHP